MRFNRNGERDTLALQWQQGVFHEHLKNEEDFVKTLSKRHTMYQEMQLSLMRVCYIATTHMSIDGTMTAKTLSNSSINASGQT